MNYSRQVFGRFRYPDKVLVDKKRVMKPGAIFIGYTSHLDPYHSWSFWNFTPLGFKALVSASDFELVELRLDIRGDTMIERAYRTNIHEPLDRRGVAAEPANRRLG